LGSIQRKRCDIARHCRRRGACAKGARFVCRGSALVPMGGQGLRHSG